MPTMPCGKTSRSTGFSGSGTAASRFGRRTCASTWSSELLGEQAARSPELCPPSTPSGTPRRPRLHKGQSLAPQHVQRVARVPRRKRRNTKPPLQPPPLRPPPRRRQQLCWRQPSAPPSLRERAGRQMLRPRVVAQRPARTTEACPGSPRTTPRRDTRCAGLHRRRAPSPQGSAASEAHRTLGPPLLRRRRCQSQTLRPSPSASASAALAPGQLRAQRRSTPAPLRR
mmetsp:Transcript_15463/g.58594  ORF Transcript_15463/g.58594 Transcript_15463/m.58594 type:complete len:227 (+) Transcript_15463:1998-2678(+)